jgi:hypothetical protein
VFATPLQWIHCLSLSPLLRFTDGPELHNDRPVLGWWKAETLAASSKKYYLANLSVKTDLRTLAATIKARWVCEQAHQQLKERTGARSLRGTILARPAPSCAHDHDRLRIPPAPPSRTSGTKKKESTAHRLSRACQPYATPSSNSSFDHGRSDARAAKDKSPRRNGVNKSAKVVLVM